VKARNQRATSKRQLSKGGVLYAHHARKIVTEREQKQAQKGRKKKSAKVNNTPFTLQWIDPVLIDPQLFRQPASHGQHR
jgi:hypothetical protein